MSNPTSQTFWQWLTGEADIAWKHLENFFKSFVSSEVAALAPIAEEALAELGIDFATATKPSDFSTAASQVLASTASKAEAKGLQVAGASIIAAVAGAIANVQTVTTPAPVVATVTTSIAVNADSTRPATP